MIYDCVDFLLLLKLINYLVTLLVHTGMHKKIDCKESSKNYIERILAFLTTYQPLLDSFSKCLFKLQVQL